MPAPKNNAYAAKAPHDRASATIQLRCTPAFKARIAQAAGKESLTLSQFVLKACRRSIDPYKGCGL